ncbi:hypothetical protein COHA_002558 [Chlorella ohadii]|uniref:Uncharacterized protein n=1 Tax=Chlorella ohadii TaxID=2649997 RepID=A0AAD5DV17_9CHLO|nr:hypothetical protein COHA_002558 [Chlorella ohadii]
MATKTYLALAQQAGAGRVELVQLDTASSASIQACVDGLKGKLGHLDVVVNNAGVIDSLGPFEQVTEKELLDCFQTNTIGPFLFTQELKRAGLIGTPGGPSVVANISSILGSIGTDIFAAYPGYAYRMSKAALNSMTRYVDIALAQEGISLVSIHPGYVKTDINQGEGDITAEESVRGILQVLESGKDLHGRFYSWAGDELPW